MPCSPVTALPAATKDGRYRAELESRWDKEGGEAMFVELRRIDPETAGNLHLNDKKRILRALEVYYETGKTMAQHNAETKLIPPRYDSVRIGLAYEDRDDMKRAIDLRVDQNGRDGAFRRGQSAARFRTSPRRDGHAGHRV